MSHMKFKDASRRGMLKASIALACSAAPALVAGRWLVGCSDGTDPGEFDQAAMLKSLADTVMLGTVEEFATKAEALSAAVTKLAGDLSTANLKAAREAWVAARAPWKQAQGFAFGPVKDLAPTIDWWPADGPAIDAIIANEGPFDSAAIDKVGSSKQGFMALEYLLFDPSVEDEAIVARLAGDAVGYCRALGENLAARAQELASSFGVEGGGYAAEFGNAGGSSSTFKSPKDAVDIVVNEIVYLPDASGNDFIARPLGLKTGDGVHPELEETWRSGNSLEDLRNRIRGLDNLWEGTWGDADGLGLKDLVLSRSEPLVGEVRKAIDDVYAAFDAIGMPLSEAFTKAADKLETAFNLMIELKRILGSDVVTVLGVTLTFNDKDGD